MPTTLVTFLLDASGSMERLKGRTIEAFNTYVEELKKDGNILPLPETKMSLIQFSSFATAPIFTRIPIEDVLPLAAEKYTPNGGTPLIDAAYKTIKAIDKSLEGMPADTKVVVCIQTDGEENASNQYSWLDLNLLIKEKTGRGWQFLFMGCGIDAYQQGAKMGVSRDSTVSYSENVRETRSVFASAGENTRNYRSGASMNAGFSSVQKGFAGDFYDMPSARTTTPVTPAPATPAPPLRKSSKNPKNTPIVDDFEL